MGTLSVRGDVLVVPPFECAWLKLDKPGEGCFTFLAKAENDVTLIFSSNAEGKRVCGTRRNSEFYTVIIGSHVNSRLVLERVLPSFSPSFGRRGRRSSRGARGLPDESVPPP